MKSQLINLQLRVDWLCYLRPSMMGPGRVIPLTVIPADQPPSWPGMAALDMDFAECRKQARAAIFPGGFLGGRETPSIFLTDTPRPPREGT